MLDFTSALYLGLWHPGGSRGHRVTARHRVPNIDYVGHVTARANTLLEAS